ncbi:MULTISPECIES: cation transporter [unclassified Butyrivibrio]|nr:MULTISPECIES: heavy metal-associated domain-containing protein [unclassified Butyrivibrio]
MVCSNCATRVENALNRNDGIYARVDLGNKKAVIHAKRGI